MTAAILRKYAMLRGKIVPLEEFAKDHPWVLSDKLYLMQDEGVPESCVSIYYTIDAENEALLTRLFVTSWNPKYKDLFKEVSVAWLEQYFSVEENDLLQLDTPEVSIINPGGEIFSLWDSEGHGVGVVAMVNYGTHAELGKMGIKKEYLGKGYAHPLMYEGIQWAKQNSRNYSHIDIYTAKHLGPAVALYKRYGFEVVPVGGYSKFSRVDLAMRLDL